MTKLTRGSDLRYDKPMENAGTLPGGPTEEIHSSQTSSRVLPERRFSGIVLLVFAYDDAFGWTIPFHVAGEQWCNARTVAV
jgi:hypothetical protein